MKSWQLYIKTMIRRDFLRVFQFYHGYNEVIWDNAVLKQSKKYYWLFPSSLALPVSENSVIYLVSGMRGFRSFMRHWLLCKLFAPLSDY